MAGPQGKGSPLQPGAPGPPDWEALERSPEFRELSARRRRFVVPALALVGLLYSAFIVLAAWGRDFMGSSIYRGFTVAFACALALIVTVWVVAWLYARFANETLSPIIDRMTQANVEQAAQEAPAAGTSIGDLGHGPRRDES